MGEMADISLDQWDDFDEFGDEDGPVELEGVLCIRETDKALLCRIEGKEHWIPKSQIDSHSEVVDAKDHKEGTLAITPWIAKQKGLV